MKDLSGHDATLKNRLDYLFKFLAIEGLFVLGLGLGWSLGLFSLGGKVNTTPLFLMGLGTLTGFAAWGIFYWKKKLLLPEFRSHNAIDIRDSLRAFRIHGNQVPLINRENFRSEIVCINKRENILLPEKHRFILEHWRGPDAVLSLAKTERDLSQQQILYFDSEQLDIYEKGKRLLQIEPGDIPIDEDLVFVLHILPKGDR